MAPTAEPEQHWGLFHRDQQRHEPQPSHRIWCNPARPGTPGGGSGGAIYNDGNTFTLEVCGSTLTENTANEGGGAIFFVSNDLSGALHIDRSHLSSNLSLGFESDPGIFALAGEIEFTDSVIE